MRRRNEGNSARGSVVRKGNGSGSEEEDEEEKEEDEACEELSAERKLDGVRTFCLLLMAILLPGTLWSAYMVYRQGFLYLVPQAYKRLYLTAAQVDSYISSRTFLFIGGPHRGGTTILWDSLKRSSPDVSGFGVRVGADFSEGMYLQSLYPTFGIGTEVGRDTSRGPGGMKKPSALASGSGGGGGGSGRKKKALKEGDVKGLGQYAFDPESHLTEDASQILIPDHQALLFNEWGFLWDLTKPVLLEKSPPNMLISRFLQRMFTPGLANDPAKSKAMFVFLSRHPIANSLAIVQWTPDRSVDDMFELVFHWVVSHEIMAADMEHLHAARYLKYEDFAKEPYDTLRSLLDWLGLPYTSLPPQLDIVSDTNVKYEQAYCHWLRRADGSNLRKHQRMVDKLNHRVTPFGYDLDDYLC